MKNHAIKLRLTVMSFLQIGLWGAYLTCMGSYLGTHGMGDKIGLFYSVQGMVSIFMPTLIGIIADRWIQAQKALGFCHTISGLAMLCAGFYGISAGESVEFSRFFTLYTIGVAFYMPTLALSNSVAYTALESFGLDTIKTFPNIRIFGTIGFIVTMWLVDLLGFQQSAMQFVVSAILSLLLAAYSFTLPHCPTNKAKSKSLIDALGLHAFSLFKQKRMAIFLCFSVFLGISLQITNGFANPFISSFGSQTEFADTFCVKHANILISLSQISETLCILLIPFFMKRFGIKKVVLIAMASWVLRFGFFGIGNPAGGVWLLILSCIIYGVAFDFYNISSALFIDKEVNLSMRSSAQGLFILMTNGIGATVGTLVAQKVIDQFCTWQNGFLTGNWSSVWFIFAGYSAIITILFAILFQYKHTEE